VEFFTESEDLKNNCPCGHSLEDTQSAKREKEDVDTLSEWVKSVRSLIQRRIKHSMYQLKLAKHLSHLHDKYVFVPVDKAPNNIVFACTSHYIDCFMQSLGINN